MYYDGWFFWGMHGFWWLFWLVLLAVFFGLVMLTPATKERFRRETPLEILQRRYAAGEISSEEYEERRAKLKRDMPPDE